MKLDATAVAVFIFFFVLVTVLGFVAARWRSGDLNQLHEWGLAGRRFGTIITWFLLGGDLYTAYTFIAIPAAMYGTGAVSGFFAIPYTILIYPLVFVLMPKFWTVCKQRGYVTAADFVKERFGSRNLALAIAFTGILATMPYIALQMYGIQLSLAALGIPITVPIFGIAIDLPLLIAFVILAAYTYTSGLRAPAMIALVKDIMIFIVLFAVIAIVPTRFHGFGPIFDAAHQKALANPKIFSDLIPANQAIAYTTLALGSALALFLYPHSLTGVLSSSSTRVVKRNAALLPIYSLMLGFLAILGYMAIAAKVKPFGGFGNNSAVPALINAVFPPWFAGFTFAAISIGALVPAAVMSIAAANLFTRNIYKEYLRPSATDREETQAAKLASLVLKFGALLFIVAINPAQVIYFQLLGGIWILQTLPAVFLGLYTRWFNRWALLIGWAAAMIAGTWMFIAAGNKPTLAIFHIPIYIAVAVLILNLLLAVILTPIFELIGLRRGQDKTTPADYEEVLAPAEPVEVGRRALS
ncbi:monocarboxylate uptake permease MctP [Dictyobacter arantiisoli]|uniref:Sodium:solute symporter n=1 Tax=Dictyobacter arantiisoli TaxID=2014874 RepID=A0A5A5T839_9CHLR|nr:sodium:solute symporter [Dictyobacter arantiisoli]GCF07640.1 sodium:solute symporter [Dictyobacter arantiisoli]